MFIAFYQLFIVTFGGLTLVNFYVYEFYFFIGLLSVFVGSWGGLKELKLMRLLGQSSIVNMGFFFIILTSAHFEGNLVFFYIYFVYSTLLIQFFSTLIILKGQVKNIAHLAGPFNYSFLFFFSLSFCVLSFAAIPPLNGFLIKFYIFDSMINYGYFSSVFFLLLHSIISAVFYIRCYTIFEQTPNEEANFFSLFHYSNL